MDDTNKMPFNWKPTIKIMVCKIKQQKEEAYGGGGEGEGRVVLRGTELEVTILFSIALIQIYTTC